MKKWITLLLVLIMVFSLAACTLENGDAPDISETNNLSQTEDNGDESTTNSEENLNNSNEENKPAEGYDAEFTIYFNGTEEWTPFPGKNDVEFIAEDDEIVSLSDNGTTVTITGTQIGDTEVGAMLGEEIALALVHVRAMEGDINYVYSPPKDNYYIAFEHFDSDGDVGSEIVARIGRQYMYSYDTTYSFNLVDFENMKAYSREPGGGWILDDAEGVAGHDENDRVNDVGPLSAMEKYFLKTFYALGGDASRISEYYVGTETLYPAPYETTGIKCWVFDIRGFNGNYLKFWIDPSNGCCLKYADTEDGDYTIVTEYNLNYTAWDNVP